MAWINSLFTKICVIVFLVASIGWGQEIRIALGGKVSNLWPLFWQTSAEFIIGSHLHGGTWNENGPRVMNIELTADGKMVLVLNDLKWSDGKPFVAKDIQYTWEMARSIWGRKLPMAQPWLNIEKLHILDQQHISIQWKHNVGAVDISLPFLLPMPSHVFNGDAKVLPKMKNIDMVGLGPLILDVQSKRKIELHDKRGRKWIFSMMPQYIERQSALERNEVDFSIVEAKYLKRPRERVGLNHDVGFGEQYLGLGFKAKGIWASSSFRLALAQTLAPKDLNRILYHDLAQENGNPFALNTSSWGNNSNALADWMKGQGYQLKDGYWFHPEKGMFKGKMLVPSGNKKFSLVEQWFRLFWKKQGLKIEIIPVPIGIFSKYLRDSNDADVWFVSYQADTDLLSWMHMFTENGILNFGKFTSTEVEKGFELLGSGHIAGKQKIAQALEHEIPYLWILRRPVPVIYSKQTFPKFSLWSGTYIPFIRWVN